MMTNKTNLKKSFMSNNRKKVKLTKVNIISLIDMLKKIYDDGADYRPNRGAFRMGLPLRGHFV